MQVNNVSSNPTSFTGKKLTLNSAIKYAKNTAKDVMEPARGGNMSRGLFITAAFAFLLSGRIFNSRDKDEKRETITRDIPTILLAINGVPLFEKITAKVLQKKSGFAIISDPKKITIASADKIQDWYRFDKTLASGFDGFMARLNTVGGNLKKITSSLGEDITAKLANFSDNNEAFMKELSKEENKALKNTVMSAFEDPKNKAFKTASFKKSLPKYAGIGITLGLVGLCIPQFNIALTEHISKKRKAKQQNMNVPKTVETPTPVEVSKTAQVSQHAKVTSLKTAQNSSSDSKKHAFSAFLN